VSVSDATETDLDRLLAAYEPLDATDPEPRVTVDGRTNPAAAVAAALRGLECAGVTAARRRRMS
jgi:hypothetical protein